MRHAKKLCIALMLTLVFLALSAMPSFAANTQAAYAKMSDELLDAFAETDGRLDVIVWLDDESTEEYQSIVASIPEPTFETEQADTADYSLQNMTENELSEEERLAQIEQMQNYIMQKRQIAQAVYLADNNAVAAELENEIDGGEIVYISRYSPLIICNVNQSEAVDIAMNSSVLSLANGDSEEVNDLAYSLPTIALGTQNSVGSATGIKIGMIELAVPDINRNSFANVRDKIIIIDEDTPDDHASFVAAIIANAVPDFDKLYCVAYSNETTFYPQVEKLLSAGVNVINMSAGRGNVCSYDDRSKWVDHIAYNHSVHFVKSAANNGSNGVSSPGMAYNVITVGNLDDRNNIYTLDDGIVPSSSYNNTYSNLAFKPDLCAPGHLIDIPNDSGFMGYDSENNTYYDMETQGTGTSFAAPHVTAVVAALCSEYPQLLRTKQALMKSILMTSVSTEGPHNYSTMFDSDGNVSLGFRQYGSGIINAFNAMTLINNGNYVNGSILSTETEDVIILGTLEAGKTVTITLTYLKRARFTSSSHTLNGSSFVESDLPDLDLFVCAAPLYIANSCGKETSHIKSVTSNNNVEKIIFTPRATDTYVICIDKVTGQDPYEILYAVSWLVDDGSLK